MSSLVELQARCTQASEDKANAERVRDALRRQLGKDHTDVDSDPAVIVALARCAEAQTRHDAAYAAYQLAEANLDEDEK
jgi:hypothetical protein